MLRAVRLPAAVVQPCLAEVAVELLLAVDALLELLGLGRACTWKTTGSTLGLSTTYASYSAGAKRLCMGMYVSPEGFVVGLELVARAAN